MPASWRACHVGSCGGGAKPWCCCRCESLLAHRLLLRAPHFGVSFSSMVSPALLRPLPRPSAVIQFVRATNRSQTRPRCRTCLQDQALPKALEWICGDRAPALRSSARASSSSSRARICCWSDPPLGQFAQRSFFRLNRLRFLYCFVDIPNHTECSLWEIVVFAI